MSNQEKEKSLEEGRIDIVEFLLDYLRIAWKMWAWFLLFTLLFAGGFYLKERTDYTPTYTASATFTINIHKEQTSGNIESATYFDNSAAEQMATTFPYILTSGVLKNKVAADMGTAVTGQISATVVPNTNLLTISVKDINPDLAYKTLQSVVENYPSVAEVIIGKTNMEMLDETGIPTWPDNPASFSTAALKGGIVGFGIIALWVVLLVFSRRTVRKENDIYKYLNTRSLGTIPNITKKKRSKSNVQQRTLFTDVKYQGKLQEPFRLIRNKIEYYNINYQNKVFLVTSAIAGEGKSTVAVNLALSLATAGKRVVLIDCDLRHPSDRKLLGLKDGVGMSEILSGKVKMKECLIYASEMGFGSEMKFLFIPGGAAIEDGSELLGTSSMKKIIDAASKWGDYVILDSAPAGILTDAVVLAQYADAALFVVRKDFARVDHIMDGMEHLAESNIQIIGSVLNGV